MILPICAGTPSWCPLGTREARAQNQDYRLGEDRQWRDSAPPPEPGSDQAIVADARRLLAQDDPAGARALLTPLIERTAREKSPWRAEALLLRGDSLLALDREYSSLYDYEEVIKKHRESDQFPIAVSRELDIAMRYAAGLKIRVLGFRIGDSDEVAIELLIRVQERLPRSQLAEKASIELADFYYRRRDMNEAYDSYDLYLASFPNGPNAVHARERRIQADLARFKGPKYNAAELINARTQVRDFVRRNPAEADASGMNEALVARLDESMAAHLLDTASWYDRSGDPASARFTLKRLLRDFPTTRSALRAEELLRERGWSDLAAKGDADPQPQGDANPAPQPAPSAPVPSAPSDPEPQTPAQSPEAPR